MAAGKPSNADLVRAAVEGAEAGGRDLSLASERRRVVDEVVAGNPRLKAASIQAALSDVLKKRAAARGDDPSKYRKKPAAKYSTSLKSSKAAAPVERGAEAGQGTPAQAGGSAPQGSGQIVGPPQAGALVPLPPNPIVEKQLAETMNAFWEGIRLMDPNIEKLDKDEKDALANFWYPFAADLLASRNKMLAVAIIGTAGLAGRKISAGRKITAAQKAIAAEREAAARKAKAAEVAQAQPASPPDPGEPGRAHVPAARPPPPPPQPDEAGLDMPANVERFDAYGKV